MSELSILNSKTEVDAFVGNAIGAFSRALSDKIDFAWTKATGRNISLCYAINQIGCEPGSSIKTLSKMLNLEHSSLVRLLDQLERDSLIQRFDSKSDKREKNIFLTETGEEILTQLINARRRVVQPMTGLLDDMEIKTLHILIAKMMPAVVIGGDDQHYVCRLCELEACPQELCPVNLCFDEWYELPEKPFKRQCKARQNT